MLTFEVMDVLIELSCLAQKLQSFTCNTTLAGPYGLFYCLGLNSIPVL